MNFSESIISWYQINKRNLPWRSTTNPYHIWISEVILQQTRVEQGLPYYEKYISTYPNINSLANAPEDEVMKLWQGLGYYSRARNMHATAKMLVEKYKGIFPKTHKEILKLKGIGEYTAAAITSLAYNLAYPVVDGNVYRVLSRFFGIKTPIDSGAGKKEFLELAGQLMDKSNPGNYNQAIMEFGAIQCKPKSPNCNECPVNIQCYAFQHKCITTLPVKNKRVKPRDRYFNYIYIEFQDGFFIKKRTGKDIWENLYDFPLIETKEAATEKDILQSNEFKALLLDSSFTFNGYEHKYKHQLTHQTLHASFYIVSLHQFHSDGFLGNKFLLVKKSEMLKYSVPRLIERFLQELEKEKSTLVFTLN